MNGKIELLAPAGNWDAFVAAVENGADAVYLGGKLFNARQYTQNFDGETLKKALDYAHVRDVNIYFAMNTLISDTEMKEAAELAAEAYLLGVDGIIVQDLGFAALLRSMFPDLPLHASTQMTIYNLEGVRELEKLGFKRVVLARELSIDEIKYIASNTSLEVEIFIHGALCISYSGQCLMSSMIGGRSGNRGRCAQPCRLPYMLINEKNEACRVPFQNGKAYEGKATKAFIMSPKDICLINELPLIIKSGVKSLKIEGRMRNPEYVATVVRIYRKYIDRLISFSPDYMYRTAFAEKKDLADLEQIFNRGGLWSGYLKGKFGREMMCYEKPKNWGIYVGKVVSRGRNPGTIIIKLEDALAVGDGIEVWNGEEESPSTVVSSIRINGKNVESAKAGEVAEVGDIKGKLFAGNRVFRTSQKALNKLAKDTYSGKFIKKTIISGKIIIKKDEPVVLKVQDGADNFVEIKSKIIPEQAINRPLTKERVIEQLNRTGSTPFQFSKIEVYMDPDITISVSELNNLRRVALEELEQRRTAGSKRKLPDSATKIENCLLHFPENGRKLVNIISNTIQEPSKNSLDGNKIKTEYERTGISVMFYKIPEEFDLTKIDADRMYLPFIWFLNAASNEIVDACRGKGMEVFAFLPSVTRGNYDKLIRSRIKQVIDTGVDGIMVGNLGSINYIRELGEIRIMGDYTLNLFNSLSIWQMLQTGLSGITISPELNFEQIKNLEILGKLTVEAIAYGRIPVMTSEYCPVGSIECGYTPDKKCRGACKKDAYYLKDRKAMKFPIFCDEIDCRSTIFNADVLFIADSINELTSCGINMLRLNITDEEPSEIREIIEMHRTAIYEDKEAIGRYENLISRIKHKGFTRGHYYRRV